jgi:predicted nucleic acid-binding protein
MKVIVDTCGWIEWLTEGTLTDEFSPYLGDLDNLIVSTSIQYELHKWICREQNEVLAMEVIALTQQANVIALTESLALLASELSQKYKLSFADAIITQLPNKKRSNLLLLMTILKTYLTYVTFQKNNEYVLS